MNYPKIPTLPTFQFLEPHFHTTDDMGLKIKKIK